MLWAPEARTLALTVYLLCLHPNSRQITAPPLASVVLSDSFTLRLVGDTKTRKQRLLCEQ